MAISREDREKGRAWKAENGFPFPLLVDGDLSVIRAWDVYHENESKNRDIARPGTFILDGAGQIVWRYVGSRASDRPKLDEVLDRLP